MDLTYHVLDVMNAFIDSSREAKIVNFMWQVKERHAGRRIAHEEAMRGKVETKATS